jgi:hypothetical protein
MLSANRNGQPTSVLIGHVGVMDAGVEDESLDFPTHFIIWDVTPVHILRDSLGIGKKNFQVASSWNDSPTNDVLNRSGGYVETGTDSVMIIARRANRVPNGVEYEIVESRICDTYRAQ